MSKTPTASSSPTSERSPIADFESSLEELELLVAKLEQGEQPLEQSLRDFERGVALFRRCEQALQHAELRVQQLLDPADPTSARPFETEPS
ncbi:MAG: exodeoxyribonuclease VII small subunit [Lysobacterales bacterium]